MVDKFDLYNYDLKEKLLVLKHWKVSRRELSKFKYFLEDLRSGRVQRGKRLADARVVKYISIMRLPLEYFKDLENLNLKKVEKFNKDLATDVLKSRFGKPFLSSTKADILSMLSVYLRWRLGKKAIPLTDWFDRRVKKKTPEYLSEVEVEKLYRSCRTAEQRFLIAVLFDTGARASEFYNLRYSDIEFSSNYIKMTFREEFSKTKGRTVSLYWKHSNDAVRDYLKERVEHVIKPSDAVFLMPYDNARQFLIRLGRKVLDRKLHFHLFRHSSATYYANKLNRQELCYRYGWAFSSAMPDVYISRTGMINKDLDEKFKSTELEEVKKRQEKTEQMYKVLLDKIEKVKFEREKIKHK